MEVAGTEYGGHDEEETNAGIQSDADDTEEEGLAQGASEGENISNEVELADLVRSVSCKFHRLVGKSNLP